MAIKRSPIRLAILGVMTLLYIQGFSVAQDARSTMSVPTSYEELWGKYDPRTEPLDVEVLHEWQEEGVTMRVLRYRVGTFKGQVAKVAAIYGYPTNAKKIPGLVQIHGGGQYADYKAVLTNGKRGYATISVSWAGRISAPDYRVDPDVVKLFWDGKKDDPRFRVTTDWGAVDGYHAPSRYKGTIFPSAKAHPWTIDSEESPRNSGWYLAAVAARRALTFLEQQPQVDADRLGVYGHSMGGKLTVMTAPDSRVKVAAPSCGGVSDRSNSSEIFEKTLCDDVYLKRIRCPIIFLSPSNDFHGRIDGLQKAVTEIKSKEWRVTCSPHHNHQDTAEYEVATQLWFDQFLKGHFETPKTPKVVWSVKTTTGIPQLAVRPDSSRKILSVDFYYTRHGQMDGERNDFDNTKARFWHHTAAVRNEDIWTGELPLVNLDQPLWAYANVLYELQSPVSGAGYYYREYTANTFNLSSLMVVKTPRELQDAGVKATLKPNTVIEDFKGDWRKEWFAYNTNEWSIRTHRVYDSIATAPDDAVKLSLTLQCDEPNQLVVSIDDYAAVVELPGGSKDQTTTLSVQEFKSAGGEPLKSWTGIRELRLGSSDRIRTSRRESKLFGGKWNGDPPVFRKLEWK